MRPRILVIGALALVVMTAGCVGGFAQADQPGSDPTTRNARESAPATSETAATTAQKTIKVGARGRLSAQPDRVIVRVAVEVTGENASIARRRLAENVSRMRRALAELGIDGDQITTAYFDLSRDRRERRRSGEEAAVVFRGRHALTIALTDTNRTGEVIVTAVENGATDIDEVQFTLSEETRRTLRQKALAEAVKNARTKAETIANASGSLSESALTVKAVRTGDVNVGIHRERAVEMAAAGGDAETSIEGGSVSVTARVVVTFNTTDR